MRVPALMIATLAAAGPATSPSAREMSPAANAEAWRAADCRAIKAVVLELNDEGLARHQELGPKESVRDLRTPSLYDLLGKPYYGPSCTVRCLEVASPQVVSGNASFTPPRWSADYERVVVVLHLEAGWRGYLLVRDQGEWRIQESRQLGYDVEPAEVWEIV